MRVVAIVFAVFILLDDRQTTDLPFCSASIAYVFIRFVRFRSITATAGYTPPDGATSESRF
jgi:hypothetical protein